MQNELKDPEGFNSYKEIHFWASLVQDIKASYITIYRLVKEELQAKLKVVRPRNKNQLPEEVEVFKSCLNLKLQALLEEEKGKVSQYPRVRFWCQDESHFGCHTIVRKRITLKGVKPIGNFQYNFKCLWLYGMVEPRTGETFYYEFTDLDSECFNQYLNLFAQSFPSELHIIQMDNAPAHLSGEVEILDNVIPFYQPPYCPEVNPIERLWEYIKDLLAWQNFDNLDDLRTKLDKTLFSFSRDSMGYLMGWSWILTALSLSGI